MTPAMKSIVFDLVKERLANIQKEEEVLLQVLQELRSELLTYVTNGVDVKKTPLHEPDVKTVVSSGPVSPLETRLEQLRVQHGPVFIIDPKNPVNAGQRIKWGKPDKPSTVEVLESAELPGKDGTVVPARYFAKLVDV